VFARQFPRDDGQAWGPAVGGADFRNRTGPCLLLQRVRPANSGQATRTKHCAATTVYREDMRPEINYNFGVAVTVIGTDRHPPAIN